MGKLIVTLCHDGKFDRVMRGREFVSALGGAASIKNLRPRNLEPTVTIHKNSRHSFLALQIPVED